MQMTPTKTSMNTVALMVHGKKYYCCAACASGKKAAAYDKAHPGKVFVAAK
jgi:predicted amidohydrolase